MLTCKEASYLISESLDKELPLSKRIGLRFHLMMCRACSSYKKQLTIISRVFLGPHNTEPFLDDSAEGLSESSKNNLIKLLEGQGT